MTRQAINVLIALVWFINWAAIFWINFSADLSIAMQLIAIPALLIGSAINIGLMLEHTAAPRQL